MLGGRNKEALKVLQKAARWNGKTFPPDNHVITAMERISKTVRVLNSSQYKLTHTKYSFYEQHVRKCLNFSLFQDANKEEQEATEESTISRVIALLKHFGVLLTTTEFRAKALVMFFCWYSAGLIYYGVSLNATNLR